MLKGIRCRVELIEIFPIAGLSLVGSSRRRFVSVQADDSLRSLIRKM